MVSALISTGRKVVPLLAPIAMAYNGKKAYDAYKSGDRAAFAAHATGAIAAGAGTAIGAAAHLSGVAPSMAASAIRVATTQAAAHVPEHAPAISARTSTFLQRWRNK